MNEGDCRCLRYIDDFIIVGPTASAVRARFKKAEAILGDLQMSFAPDKTSSEPIPLSGAVEFLGIEICPGIIRPSARARAELIRKLRSIADSGSKGFREFKNGKEINKSDALINTLRRLDGTIEGWSKHYWFCNDQKCFENLDTEVAKIFCRYMDAYNAAQKSSPTFTTALLGIGKMKELDPKHFKYPKRL